MAKHAWIALVIIAGGWALASPCLADDDTPEAEDVVDPSPGVTTIDELLAATADTDIYFVVTAPGARPDVIDPRRISFALEDNGVFGRLRRDRSLSFLTLSNHRRSRLYLGVNEEGFVGLHFGSD